MQPRPRPTAPLLRAAGLLATALLATTLLLTGCSADRPAASSAADTEPWPGQTASDRVGAPGLEALRTKFRFYAQDPCWSADPAAVFPRCGRFTTEIRNALPQVRQDAPAAAAQADLVGKALDDFAAQGCQADPGTLAEGDASVCGPAFRAVQETVQGMATAAGAGT
ncbi:hypothetical protein [Pseudonocardia sp. ICBG1293]|uniref:hypothetical protein n=1 Tax=Pseudonocardia sp. ICBG1293 TaxID=2844382 RepID=UPI001CCE46EC|nr:hypothetical protein [Pseudonocardia sp. ICBG1293]